MGFNKNEAVIVHFAEAEWAGSRMDDFLATLTDWQRAIFARLPAAVNGGLTYFMAPDGSKEGWPESDEFDHLRQRFIAAALTCEFPDILHVQLGGDERLPIIHFSTDLARCSFCNEHSALEPCPER